MELPELTPAVITLLTVEVALYLAGLATIYLWQFGDGAADRRRVRITAWNVSLGDFLLGALVAILGALALQMTVIGLHRARPDQFSADGWLILQGGAFQLGLLGGALVARKLICLRPIEEGAGGACDPATEAPPWGTVRGGVLLFLASLPLVFAVSLVWQQVLKAAGVPLAQQELIELLRNTDSPGLVAGLAFLAVIVAPIAEETLFRAGLFRYLRTRIPRIAALLISSLVFAALHGNPVAFGPLVALGILLAIAYERTGRIAVPIIAHGLFNLHTLVLLMTGIDI